MGPGESTVGASAWATLQAEIERCVRCPLHATRQRVVVYRGSASPLVLFVGEAPGAAEDAAGRPFVGRAGQRLDRAVAALGLSAAEYGMLNLIKCRPPANRYSPIAAARCRPFLDRQLELLRPPIVVPLGRHALRAFDPSAPPISQAAGRPRRVGGTTLFPLIHPAAVRSHATRERWEHDLERFGRWLAARRWTRRPSQRI